MPVFRAEHDRDFTVMSNRPLRDRDLSLKAKGLLWVMLSLPEDWNYNVRGLASLCREGRGAVAAALRELEEAGYVTRRTLRGRGGRIRDTEYAIRERPEARGAHAPRPENPAAAHPDAARPAPETGAQPKKERPSTQPPRTKRSAPPSLPFSPPPRRDGEEAKRRAAQMRRDFQQTRAQIRENIEYESLLRRYPHRQAELEELEELLVETVCARRETVRICGSLLPRDVVRSRLLKLTGPHLEFVMECLGSNTAEVRNMKQYLLSVLFNAPVTMEHFYAARVNHDLAEGG